MSIIFNKPCRACGIHLLDQRAEISNREINVALYAPDKASATAMTLWELIQDFFAGGVKKEALGYLFDVVQAEINFNDAKNADNEKAAFSAAATSYRNLNRLCISGMECFPDLHVLNSTTLSLDIGSTFSICAPDSHFPGRYKILKTFELIRHYSEEIASSGAAIPRTYKHEVSIRPEPGRVRSRSKFGRASQRKNNLNQTGQINRSPLVTARIFGSSPSPDSDIAIFSSPKRQQFYNRFQIPEKRIEPKPQISSPISLLPSLDNTKSTLPPASVPFKLTLKDTESAYENVTEVRRRIAPNEENMGNKIENRVEALGDTLVFAGHAAKRAGKEWAKTIEKSMDGIRQPLKVLSTLRTDSRSPVLGVKLPDFSGSVETYSVADNPDSGGLLSLPIPRTINPALHEAASQDLVRLPESGEKNLESNQLSENEDNAAGKVKPFRESSLAILKKLQPRVEGLMDLASESAMLLFGGRDYSRPSSGPVPTPLLARTPDSTKPSDVNLVPVTKNVNEFPEAEKAAGLKVRSQQSRAPRKVKAVSIDEWQPVKSTVNFVPSEEIVNLILSTEPQPTPSALSKLKLAFKGSEKARTNKTNTVGSHIQDLSSSTKEKALGVFQSIRSSIIKSSAKVADSSKLTTPSSNGKSNEKPGAT